ncbi:hypothetical protein ACFL5O_11010 [Myxococcota bacterium]
MSKNVEQSDAGHLSLLELVRVISDVAGPAFTSGALLKTGAGMARHASAKEYPDLDAFLHSIEAAENAIAAFEGRAKHYGNGVFGLPACPFANSIRSYRAHVGELPQEYAAVTDAYNRDSAYTGKLRVGHGAGVSPFCAVHQPIRSAIAQQIRVGGKPVLIYQLGCKSGDGRRGIAERFLAETGVGREVVDKVLDENMCRYLVTTPPE